MGFFKDFKDDFSQALNELLPGDGFAEADEIQVNTLDDELDVEQELSKLDGLLEQVEKKSGQTVSQEVQKKTEPEHKAEPEAEPEQDPEPQAEPESAKEPEPELEAEPEPEKEPEPELQAEPEPELEPAPELQKEPEAEVELQLRPLDELEINTIEGAVMEATGEASEKAEKPVEIPKATELYDIHRKDTMKEEKTMDTMDTTVTSAAQQAAEAAVEAEITAAVDSEVTDEVSVITAGTKIKGNMETTGSFEIEGKIEGDIKCNGKLTVIGTIVGNSASSEFFADAAHIEGEVVSSGTVKVGLGSVVIGNITATSAVIAGAVKGDIDVQGPVVVDTSAVIMGNIKSRSVQINNGAVIEGFCSQCYSDVDVESLFAKSK